jgi:MinD superfamily P-loop ATPase
MIISVASGKGGTGKTTIAVNLALSLKNVQFLDCDVEEPNAHIFLKPSIKETKAVSILVPKIDESKCNFCGRCAQICAYNALAVLKDKVLVFSQLCHGCGGCKLLCPQKAITEMDREIGVIEIGSSDNLQFVHGRLNIGEAMPVPLIRAVKKYINSKKVVIIDVSPRVSCPVIEAVKGSDFCILVTEPTPFGLYDLTLAVEVLRKLNIPFGVIINRSDIGDNKLDEYCRNEEISVLMRIPFKREIASCYSKGRSILEVFPEYRREFELMFEKIRSRKIKFLS